jgi:hypothetical protein
LDNVEEEDANDKEKDLIIEQFIEELKQLKKK